MAKTLRNPYYDRRPLLSAISIVRLMLKTKTFTPPETDENGYAVMSGEDEYYRLLTANGRDEVLIMSFAPANADDDHEIANWTFYVCTNEEPDETDQLLLKKDDDFLVVWLDEREQHPAAAVFGSIKKQFQTMPLRF